MLSEKIQLIQTEIENYSINNEEVLENYRLKYLSKKGVIASFFEEMKEVAPQERKQFGQQLNLLKNLAESKFKEAKQQLEEAQDSIRMESAIDLTLPTIPQQMGSIHPLSLVKQRIVEIFERIGFHVAESFEMEDDWHNFTALNFALDHPAREMQDTFFIEKNPDIALRTHTSSVQIRLMEQQKPPFRSIMPGRVFRNEAISARAHCVFHQVEGLYVDENVSFLDLKQTLYHFVKEMFGKDTQIRFRPSFFPFTEPSAEIDISCHVCKGKGCNVCKYSGWVEIGGSGMVHPNVLRNCGIDPEKYTGFAFGMGIERISMLKYRIKDLRLFTENDIRFLQQFSDL